MMSASMLPSHDGSASNFDRITDIADSGEREISREPIQYGGSIQDRDVGLLNNPGYCVRAIFNDVRESIKEGCRTEREALQRESENVDKRKENIERAREVVSWIAGRLGQNLNDCTGSIEHLEVIMVSHRDHWEDLEEELERLRVPPTPLSGPNREAASEEGQLMGRYDQAFLLMEDVGKVEAEIARGKELFTMILGSIEADKAQLKLAITECLAEHRHKGLLTAQLEQRIADKRNKKHKLGH